VAQFAAIKLAYIINDEEETKIGRGSIKWLILGNWKKIMLISIG
jgi:hypothetical protein